MLPVSFESNAKFHSIVDLIDLQQTGSLKRDMMKVAREHARSDEERG